VTYEGPRRLAGAKLEPEVEFSRYGAFYRISSYGHIFDIDPDIFTKFGGYAADMVPQRAELSKYASFRSLDIQNAGRRLSWIS